MNTSEKIKNLRNIMKEKSIDWYIVPSGDFHQSEYVCDYFKGRAYLSGFTGSAGTLIVGKEEAGLWTDGRYFIQAEGQLAGSGITLYKTGEPGVPTVEEFMKEKLSKGENLGIDGRLFALEDGKTYKKIAYEKEAVLVWDIDLLPEVWKDRPELSKEKAYALDVKYAGESVESKLERVREVMKNKGANAHIIGTLDDNCWLLNFRGKDGGLMQVALCYVVVNLDSVELFIDKSKLNDEIMKGFGEAKVNIHDYNDVYEYVKTIDGCVLIDPIRVNYALIKSLKDSVKIEFAENPTVLFKAIKNKVELENTRKGHIKDGLAVTRFMRYIKENAGKEVITELSATDKLEEFRKQQEGYICQSFSPICAYKDHAAMMHYSSTEETDCQIKEGHMFLNDTGGNYYEGSTDITRTFVVGSISEELKEHFTAVARGMINLSRAKFMKGCIGLNLDILARGPVWDLGINYNCGTGHGVGYLLSIHEDPQGIRWKYSPWKSEQVVLQEGMVVTNEPGIYIEGSHGIRIENELVVHEAEKNEHGEFMNFETITFAPIDLDGINPDLMSKVEKDWLNNYHKQVFEKLSPYMDEDEKAWLVKYTRAI